MAQKKEGPTLEQVRAVAEKIARDQGVTVAEVTGAEVSAVFGRGSDGYVFAHLQTVKLEYVRSIHFQPRDLSVRLMAALHDEYAQRDSKTEERVRSEEKVTQDLFEEVCHRNNALDTSLTACKQDIEKLHSEHALQVQSREDELAMMRAQMTKLESLLAIAEQARTNANAQLTALHIDHGASKEKLIRAEKDVTEAKTEISALKKRLYDSEDARDKLLKTAGEREQRSQLLNWQNDLREKEIANLKAELADANRRAATAVAQLELQKEGCHGKPEANNTKKSKPLASA